MMVIGVILVEWVRLGNDLIHFFRRVVSSVGLERLVYTQKVTGSIPVPPTIHRNYPVTQGSAVLPYFAWAECFDGNWQMERIN